MNEFQEFKIRASDRRALNELSLGGSRVGSAGRRKGKRKTTAQQDSMLELSPSLNPSPTLLRFPLGKISCVPMKISWLTILHFDLTYGLVID